IIMPFFGPLILAFIYDGGKQTRKKKIKKELDKMKAKDITQKQKRHLSIYIKLLRYNTLKGSVAKFSKKSILV
ncbi:hypothetical protein MXZ22_09950, partial [Streptococcus uberis]|nr:hypothetical protein [Streptococcus uberis]